MTRKTKEQRARLHLLRRTPYGDVLFEEVLVGPHEGEPTETAVTQAPRATVVEASTMTGVAPDYKPADPPGPRIKRVRYLYITAHFDP